MAVVRFLLKRLNNIRVGDFKRVYAVNRNRHNIRLKTIEITIPSRIFVLSHSLRLFARRVCNCALFSSCPLRCNNLRRIAVRGTCVRRNNFVNSFGHFRVYDVFVQYFDLLGH